MSLGDVFLSYDGDKFRVFQIKGPERKPHQLAMSESLEDAIKWAYNEMYVAPGRELRVGLELNRWTVSA